MKEKCNYFFTIWEHDEIITKVVICFEKKPKHEFIKMLNEANCVVINKEDFQKEQREMK